MSENAVVEKKNVYMPQTKVLKILQFKFLIWHQQPQKQARSEDVCPTGLTENHL